MKIIYKFVAWMSVVLLTGCAAQMTYVQTPQQLINAGAYYETRHIGPIDVTIACINKNQSSKIDQEWVLRSQPITSEKDREIQFFRPKTTSSPSHLAAYARVLPDGTDTRTQWWVSKIYVSPESVFRSLKGSC